MKKVSLQDGVMFSINEFKIPRKDYKVLGKKEMKRGDLNSIQVESEFTSNEKELLAIQNIIQVDSQTIGALPLRANRVTSVEGQYSANAQASTFTINNVEGWETPPTVKPF